MRPALPAATASGFGTAYLKAIREVLPAGTGTWAVGGTGVANFGEWLAAGAEGIGVGGALYTAGDDAANADRNNAAEADFGRLRHGFSPVMKAAASKAGPSRRRARAWT